jgi:N-acetylneuraminic acid mutarotase
MKNKLAPTLQRILFEARFYLLLLLVFSISGTLLAFFGTETQTKTSHPAPAGLTFAQRVAYQQAIEDVYWRHRIWPKERPDTKPSLSAVMSRAQLENKVADYLRKSDALEEHRRQLITAEQLQTEMDRMAQHTKQPEVLRELFQALGNDPFVIAECLARPVLTERLVGDLSAPDNKGRFNSARSKRLRSMSMGTTVANSGYTLPQIAEGNPPCADDSWAPTCVTNAPAGRSGHSAVWTGTEMIVWGGLYPPTNTGGKYNPGTDSWTATSITNAPSTRYGQTAIWTGSEMIVWGGTNCCPNYFNTGGRYNPSTDTWTATRTSNAPSARQGHTAVWTGSEMIVWGGRGSGGDPWLNTGGRYNPSTNSWIGTSTSNAPSARETHTAVWTGNEMIIWGGDRLGSSYMNTGGRYNPTTDTWAATTTGNTPPRSHHTAVWTGSEMIVWGGVNDSGALNTGRRYSPGTDNWVATSTTNVPDARDGHTSVWCGSEMIVWGGYGFTGIYFDTGGRYNPTTDTWTATTTLDVPTGRTSHTAVWTGSEMIVWGGGNNNTLAITGGRYGPRPVAMCPPGPTATATPRRPIPTPRPRPTLPPPPPRP